MKVSRRSRHDHEWVPAPNNPLRGWCECGYERWSGGTTRRSWNMHFRHHALVGREVRTLRVLENGIMRIPKGTICEITGMWRGGYSLRGKPCRKCGVAVSISQVPKSDVVLLEVR